MAETPAPTTPPAPSAPIARISKKLNLVIPVDRDDGSTVYVHSTPIPKELFERKWMVMSRALNMINLVAGGPLAGIRTAVYALRDSARQTGDLDGPDGIEEILLPEIWRLTNVIVPSGRSWEPMPLADAVREGKLSDEDRSEVEHAVCFFILCSLIQSRAELAKTLTGLELLLDARTTLSTPTAFAASLPTSNGAETSGATPPPPDRSSPVF